MDFDVDGDISGGLPGPRGSGEDATRAEQSAAAVALLLFPALGFCIVLFAELWKQGLPLLLALAAGLSLAGFVITRRLSERMSFALVTALQGAFWNSVAVAGAAFMGAILSVSTGFS
jgi:hypothetical protein